MVMFTFSVLDQKDTFWKSGPKNQYFMVKFGTFDYCKDPEFDGDACFFCFTRNSLFGPV